MLKAILIVALLIHGAIHLFGFAKAFGLGDVHQLTEAISRPWGLAWLGAALLFILSAIARIAGALWWWMPASVGLVVSQVLIVAFWADARFGTIVNVGLLLPVVVAAGVWRFSVRADKEVSLLATRTPTGTSAVVSSDDTSKVPAPVARWLHKTGVVGLPVARAVHLVQRGSLQTEAGGAWLPFHAEQWVVTHEPSFLWLAKVDSGFGMHLAGRDRFLDGKGAMRIELLSLIPVVDKNGPTIDQGALVRFLAEMMWYPSAALNGYVEWQTLESPNSARATIRYGNVEAVGTFRFGDGGDVLSFSAQRYREDSLETWTVDNDPSSYREFDGIRMPARSTVTWRKGADDAWTWLKLEVVSMDHSSSR